MLIYKGLADKADPSVWIISEAKGFADYEGLRARRLQEFVVERVHEKEEELLIQKTMDQDWPGFINKMGYKIKIPNPKDVNATSEVVLRVGKEGDTYIGSLNLTQNAQAYREKMELANV
jgi:hypothetical protein